MRSLLAAVLTVAFTLSGCTTGRQVPHTGPEQSAPPTIDAVFVHPGVLLESGGLVGLRQRAASGDEPWATASAEMLASGYASLDYAPRPRRVIECGPFSTPNHGCTDERKDAIAAYTHALAWTVTGDVRHARKSVEIMNAWSASIEDHTNSNARLQAAWAGAVWPRAAEIIRHTYSGWSEPQVGRFESMLQNVYLPEVAGRTDANGNWELAMVEAAIGIAVFTDDAAAYADAVAIFLDRVPAYIYLEADGSVPRTTSQSPLDSHEAIVDYWHGQSTFADGVTQETCRDLGHTAYGLTSIAHILETTAIQGDDLYDQVGARLSKALELHAQIAATDDVPGWLCGGTVVDDLRYLPDTAISALTDRLGCPMPWSRTYNALRPSYGTDEHLVAWETLTHAGANSVDGQAQEASPDSDVCPG